MSSVRPPSPQLTNEHGSWHLTHTQQVVVVIVTRLHMRKTLDSYAILPFIPFPCSTTVTGA